MEERENLATDCAALAALPNVESARNVSRLHQPEPNDSVSLREFKCDFHVGSFGAWRF